MVPEFQMGQSIPRILHQIHFQGWDALRPEIRRNAEALKERNPGWEYRFYDADSAEDFIRKTMESLFLRLITG